MPYDFFINAINNGLAQLPNESMRDRQQAAINAGFDVTTNKYTIKEQREIGSEEYHDVDVWIGNSVEMTTRGLTNGDDFKQITFESIDHKVEKGLYYIFDNNAWLTHFTDRYSSLDVTIGLRRCNNVMKIIDPQNGSIFCIPCVVEYDMTAPNVQVTSAILTPNAHAKVMVQGNEDTKRLFRINTRYILGGRPFKILGYQNAIENKNIATDPTLLRIDLFLDEKHSGDDIENQIADNGVYDYSIEMDSEDMELTSGATGTLSASISLNGQEVKREIVWESTSPEVVSIDSNGHYKVLGNNGDKCSIVARLKGNSDVATVLNINVVSMDALKPKILIEPSFDRIRQYETIEFKIMASYGSNIYIPGSISASLEQNNSYLSLSREGEVYKITAKEIAPDKQFIYISVENTDPNFKATYELPIDVVSMMG